MGPLGNPELPVAVQASSKVQAKAEEYNESGTSATLKLLDVTLKASGAILASCMGEFSGSSKHELAVVRGGGIVELMALGTDFSLTSLVRVETRSVVRSIVPVRVTGSKKDLLCVGADGGCLSILEFMPAGSPVPYKVLHCPAFGKTGCRRGTPGQYVAADPKGRAVLVAALEKRKLVYVLNRDANSAEITLASPLEAHRSRTITLDVIGLDNGYDNPLFAALELQYPDLEDIAGGIAPQTAEKQLAYYELDLGLNHVSRRWATTTAHASACCLAAIPGGGIDGPGGVLIGGEDWIQYTHEGMDENNAIVCAIPRRTLHPPDKGILIQSIVVHRQKKSKFFALAQSELGDVYKILLELDPADKTKVVGMSVALLDTLITANSLNVSKLGLLFCAAEFGDHALYQFERIDLPDAPTNTSHETTDALAKYKGEEPFFSKTAHASQIAKVFTPTLLKNLRKVTALDSLAPTTGLLVGELAGQEVSPQLYTLVGRGPRSTLRILRHGMAVTELAVSDLPGTPGAIYTIIDNSEEGNQTEEDDDEMDDDEEGPGKKRRLDKFIVVSFADATLVLSVGETVEEMGRESGFLTNAPTLACCALGKDYQDGGICQVNPGGVRHIQIKTGRAKQWHCPGLKRIECASANESQVLIALAGGEVIYFELDPVSGNLIEAATRDMGADVCCLDLGTVPAGRTKSMFAAVGCRDMSVRIISLQGAANSGTLLAQRSSTALASRPHSVALQFPPNQLQDTILTVGLSDGSSLRATVDPITGAIGTSPARRFLGARPVSVSRITLGGQPATLLLSSRPWIGRMPQGSGSSSRNSMAPLSYVPLDHACAFSSAAVREGIVATSGNTLRILSVQGADGGGAGGDEETFNSNKVELRYTPRQMTLLSTGGGNTPANPEPRKLVLAIVESDVNEYGLDEKKSMGFDGTGTGQKKKKKKGADDDDDAMDMDEGSDDEDQEKKDENDDDDEDEEEKEARKTPIRGPYPSMPGTWGSCVRLVDPANGCATLDCVELTNRNEAALCCTSVRFHSRGGEALLAVGTVTGMTMHPLAQKESHVVLYRVVNGCRLQLLHRTKVDDGPVLALAHFQGRLLVGIGKTLRLYEMGKRQLLRKCELRGLPTMVKSLQATGDRAYVGDLMHSIQFVRYDSMANRLVLFANDRTPRPITCQELLDVNTVAVGDKFGNISVLRLPRGADAGAVDVSGTRALWDSSRGQDATPKLSTLCHYHVGEVVTSMTRASLVAGGAESLIYVTVTGRVGALVPFQSRETVEFYGQLEASLRSRSSPVPRPTGREPQAYRSYYAPVKHVVDGDLCSAYHSLPLEQQTAIAEKLDRSVGEVIKKLEDTQNGLL